MIRTKKELCDYLDADRRQLGISRKYPRFFTDEIWKYQIVLRKYEFWINHRKTPFALVMKMLYKIKWHNKSVKYGLFIPPNVCDSGLSIAHMPGVVINDQACVGKNVRIHEGVTVGASGGKAPRVGDGCFLETGCKIIGDVTIAPRCVVGAGAVVVKDVKEEGITLAGVPAKKVSQHDADSLVYWFGRRER